MEKAMNVIYDNEGLGYNSYIPLPLRQIYANHVLPDNLLPLPLRHANHVIPEVVKPARPDTSIEMLLRACNSCICL